MIVRRLIAENEAEGGEAANGDEEGWQPEIRASKNRFLLKSSSGGMLFLYFG